MIDKLELLSKFVTKDFLTIAENGPERYGYAHFVDLKKSKCGLPVSLFCGGKYNQINKIVFQEVATISLRRIRNIVRQIFGHLHHVRIYRIDWAADIPDVTPWQLNRHCRVAGVQKSGFFRSRAGSTYYPHMSHDRTILIYAKSSRHTASFKSKFPNQTGRLTRFEVQFKGRGVPIREFERIEHYADVNFINGVTFLELRPMRGGLKPVQQLAAIGMEALIKKIGLQNAAKMFPAANWAYLSKKFFEPVPRSAPDIQSMMREEARFWIEGGRRFPRTEARNAR